MEIATVGSLPSAACTIQTSLCFHALPKGSGGGIKPPASDSRMASNDKAFEIRHSHTEALCPTLSTFSDTTDDFDSAARSFPWLHLAEALGDNSVSATGSLLFTLPDELLNGIMSLLPQGDLEDFAVVNSDCCQLARVVLFEHIRFDYSGISLYLLDSLHQERLAYERSRRSRKPKIRRKQKVSFGRCVRRITVATSAAEFYARHGIDPEKFGVWDRERIERVLKSATHSYYMEYMKMLTSAIRWSLPNLQLISWFDGIRISPVTLKAILESSVRHLKLDRIQVDKESMGLIDKIPSCQSCKLATLDLFVSRSLEDQMDQNKESVKPIYPFVAFMFRQCAETLTTLKWEDRDQPEQDGNRPPLPKLLNLRKLSLHAMSIRSATELESMILPGSNSKLVHLELGLPNKFISEFINKRGTIPNLRTLVWHGFGDIGEVPIEFLQQNPHLEILSLQWLPQASVDGQVLPLLVEKFYNLTSLELAYNEHMKTIPDDAYAALSRLKGLQQLHLSAGHSLGWKLTWLIDHGALRSCVKRFPNLKRLALSRDTYPRWNFSEDGRRYRWNYSGDDGSYYSHQYFMPSNEYEQRLANRWRNLDRAEDDVDDDGWGRHEIQQQIWEQRRKWSWEMMHRRRMLKQANKYVNLRYEDGPKLKFLYFGQLPMEVKFGWYGWRAVAVTEYRDDAYTMLQRMFKKTGDLFSEAGRR